MNKEQTFEQLLKEAKKRVTNDLCVKMIYNSLKGKMGNELHALALKTKEKNGPTN